MPSTNYYLPVSPSYNSSASGNPWNGSSSDDGLFDKERVLRACISRIHDAIERRRQLHDRILETIDRQMCQLKSALYEIAPYGLSAFTVGDPKRRVSLEQELSRLEGEKRHEETGAWRDIAGLERELRELQERQDEERRLSRVMRP